jgi:hypothetical protein
MQSLSHLSRLEKVRMINDLWDDLTHDTEYVQSPGWHEQALEETRQQLANGEIDSVDWNEAKQILRNKLK